jgi:peptidyl-prolyl cis-trans isomerase D
MFEFVRSHKRLLQFLLVILIFPSFVFFGVQGYTSFQDASMTAVAVVDGRDVTRGEWEQAHQRGVDRMRQQMPGVDAKLLDTPAMRQQTLDALVRDRVLVSAAVQDHLMPGDERLGRLFRDDPQLAGLRNADGTINRDLLAARGLSSEGFAEQLRMEYGMRQVLEGLSDSASLPKASVRAAVDAFLQRRAVAWERFDAADRRARVTPTPAEVESFFKTHQERFRRPEQARIDYLVLDIDALTRKVSVNEDELKRFYEQNASRYTRAEERRASHILIKAEADLPAAERQKARERAQAVLAEVRANPASFEAVAKARSEDPGSAAQGGDLDFFGRGAMVKGFEDAVFAMKLGEIGNVVETEFGFHIIRLTEVRGGEKQPFDAVRAEIEQEVRRQLAQRRFAEDAEQFTNLVFEQPDSLQPAIERLGLDKRSATVRRLPAPEATGALASPRLLQAVFTPEAINDKRNTEAIDLGGSQLVSARVVEHMPSRIPALDEVLDEVRAAVVEEQAASLARQEGQARLAALKATPTTALPGSGEISRTETSDLPRRVVDAVLQVKPDALPAVLGVDLGAQGYVVARVDRVLPPPKERADDPSVAAQIAQAWAAAEAEAYLGTLRERFKVEMKAPAAASAGDAEPSR